MPTESPSRRGRSRLRLKIRSADEAENLASTPEPPQRTLPAPASAALVGLTAGVAGWFMVVLVVLVSWIAAPAGGFGAAIGGATQVWLLAHGGGLRIGQVSWTLIPLGLTIGVFFLAARAAVSAWNERPGEEPAVPDEPRVRLRSRVVDLLLPLTGGYAASVLIAGLIGGHVAQAGRGVLGAAVVVLLGAAWGLARRGQFPLMELVPEWARVLPVAAATGIAAVLTGGAAALAVSLLQHRQRVSGIAEGLGVDGASVIQMVLAQLAFLPNLLIWAGSWTLGAGFRFGTDSVVSPAATNLGLVPSIPVLGALPAEGSGRWLLLWLVVGVIAGVVTAVVVLRRRPEARLEEATGVCGLAGVLAAIGFTLLGLVSRGALGVDRLTGLGPRMGLLLLLGGALLGLSALVTGLIAGFWRLLKERPRRSTPEEEPADAAREPEDDVRDEPVDSYRDGPLDDDGDDEPTERVDEGEVTLNLRDRVDP